jgi:hypothetical protein
MATPTTLPAAFVSGAVLTADQMNNLRGAFRVLQVVSATTATAVTNNTNVQADTGLTATITPQSTSSKILVMVSQAGCEKTAGNANNALNLFLYRGASQILQFAYAGGFTGTTLQLDLSFATTYLDSPATTSATTYKTTFANFTNAAGVIVQVGSVAASTITLMEISA